MQVYHSLFKFPKVTKFFFNLFPIKYPPKIYILLKITYT